LEIGNLKERALCDPGQLPNIKRNKKIKNSFMSNTQYNCLGVESLNKTQKVNGDGSPFNLKQRAHRTSKVEIFPTYKKSASVWFGVIV
jgi:hypothetical protein